MAGIGCALLGFQMAQRLGLREALLASWLRVAEGLLRCVSYQDDPLPELLDKVICSDTPTDRKLGIALKEAAQLMRTQRALDFNAALALDACTENLTETDRAIIMTLVRELGKSARAQQLQLISGTCDALRGQAEQARAHSLSQRRLYLSLGSMGGIALFLCLL